MARRLLLLADGSHEAAWSRANGKESALRVKGLGAGDKVWLKVELNPEGELMLFFDEGVTPLLPFQPSEWSRYRSGKIANGKAAVTSVEVIFG